MQWHANGSFKEKVIHIEVKKGDTINTGNRSFNLYTFMMTVECKKCSDTEELRERCVEIFVLKIRLDIQ
jgi:hypothetical protein